jgi:hypothetical protein
MPGDDSHDEGDPNQKHTKKEYTFLCFMVEEMEIEPFSNDLKLQRTMIANKFNHLHERGFNKFDMLCFKTWTKKLRLSSVLRKRMKVTSNACFISL